MSTKPPLITLDADNLEQEWTDHPGAVHWVNIQWAEALRERKFAEFDLESVLAREDVALRTAFDNAGKKTTETEIKRLLLANSACREAAQKRDEAAHIQHLVESERTALDHKKSALENIVKLRLSDWYSEPKGPTPEEQQLASLADRKPRGKKPKRIT